MFSCEIEPWKQAYIERNFQPPILFRDIRELGHKEATTAYGALVPVPGRVDLLVAGTSCVDNSNLNPNKVPRKMFAQEITAYNEARRVLGDREALGESGETFLGMFEWVCEHKPTMIVLENVCGALWEMERQMLLSVGYESAYIRLDTKNFYIPHTRTRVYMLAVLATEQTAERVNKIVRSWAVYVREMERAVMPNLEHFLLPADDPRLMRVRAAMAAQMELKSRSRVDWEKCAARHESERIRNLIGRARPVTEWSEGGHCTFFDYAWRVRVVFSLDILMHACTHMHAHVHAKARQ